jgi:hypothetical protein
MASLKGWPFFYVLRLLSPARLSGRKVQAASPKGWSFFYVLRLLSPARLSGRKAQAASPKGWPFFYLLRLLSPARLSGRKAQAASPELAVFLCGAPSFARTTVRSEGASGQPRAGRFFMSCAFFGRRKRPAPALAHFICEFFAP